MLAVFLYILPQVGSIRNLDTDSFIASFFVHFASKIRAIRNHVKGSYFKEFCTFCLKVGSKM